MIAPPEVEAFVRGADLPFAAFGEKLYTPGRIAGICEQLSKLQGEEAVAFSFQKIAEATEMAFVELPVVLREQGVGALVLDEVLFGLGLVPMQLGMPYVHISNALPFDFSGKTPLCVYPWPHETTPEALARNREGVKRFAQIDKARIEVARAYASRVGLDIDWSKPFATISRLAWLVQMPRKFDFEAAAWPKPFHYTGPWHDGSGRMNTNFPWDRMTGDPLNLCLHGNPDERTGDGIQHDRRSSRESSWNAIGAFHWSESGSLKYSVCARQRDRSATGTATGTAQAFRFVHYARRPKHDT
jgi:hypothetical protein